MIKRQPTTAMTEINATENSEKKSLNFIEQIVEKDLQEGKNGGKVQTRFPPEPNGYLHIGHAKAICLDFGIAQKYGGVCNLRFDDTNPTKEDMEYVEAIKEDIQWLGFQWGHEYYASDYFQQLWDFAIRLIKEGKAYVDEQTSEEIAAQKGTPTQPGTESPYRNRPIEESLELFQKMNSGEIEEGKMVLRAKIDMANPNMHFRDPIIYRVVKTPHHRTGDKWKAYPMYDFAHGQSDYFEGVTHSLCTLEFVVHRPLYDLFVDWVKEGKDLDDNRPHQYEFNKLNLNYTLMSKRNLLILVKEGLVDGWDDPRMPTICGFRRRGYSPESIRNFVNRRPERTSHTRFGGHQSRQAGSDQLPGRQGGSDGGCQQSGRPRLPDAHDRVFARVVDRTRGLHGNCSQKVFPHDPGAGSKTEKCIYRKMYRLQERRERKHHGSLCRI